MYGIEMETSLFNNNKIKIRSDEAGVLKRIESLLNINKIVLIPEEVFISTLSSSNKMMILNLLSRGPLKASEIARSLKINRSLVYKYLRELEEKGFIEKINDLYRVVSNVYIGYRLYERNKEIIIKMSSDKIAYIDEIYGIFFITIGKDLIPLCGECIIYESCNKILDDIVRRYKIKIDKDILPAYKISKIISENIRKNIRRYLSRGYIILKR